MIVVVLIFNFFSFIFATGLNGDDNFHIWSQHFLRPGTMLTKNTKAIKPNIFSFQTLLHSLWTSLSWSRYCQWLLVLLLCVYVPLCIDTNFFHKTTENYITKIMFVSYNGSLRGSWPWLTCFCLPLIIITRKLLFWHKVFEVVSTFIKIFLVLRGKPSCILYLCFFASFPSITGEECISSGSFDGWKLFSTFFW